MSPVNKPINVCVLGVGLAGLAFHVPFVLALPEYFKLHAVLERNPTSDGGKVKGRFDVAPQTIHRTIEEVCADPEIQLVIVGTPNETHYDYAKAALNAGKHVLVDKPVAPDAALALELRDLAKSKGLVLYPFQNRRWDSDYLALKSLLALPPTDAQSLGGLVEFESHMDRYRNVLKGTWKDEAKPGAGQLFDLGSHLIDQALTLFGRPATVTGIAENVRGLGSPDVDDSFTVILRYAPGQVSKHPFTAILRGHILSARAKQPRFIVRGDKGTYLKFGVDGQEDQLRAMPTPQDIYSKTYGVEPESLYGTLDNIREDGSIAESVWPSKAPGSYQDLFRNLAESIWGTAEQAVKWEESALAVQVIQLAHQSSREGRTLSVPAA